MVRSSADDSDESEGSVEEPVFLPYSSVMKEMYLYFFRAMFFQQRTAVFPQGSSRDNSPVTCRRSLLLHRKHTSSEDLSPESKEKSRKVSKPATINASTQTDAVSHSVPIDVSVQTDAIFVSMSAAEVNSVMMTIKADLENQAATELSANGLEREAISSYAKAVDFGSVEAMYNLAMYYCNGVFVPKNINQAVLLWEKASNLGHAPSTYQLAVCHIKGLGKISKNPESGMKLMEKSAKGGYADAQFHVAKRLLLDNQASSAKPYLEGAVRKKEFVHELEKLLEHSSLPYQTRSVIERVIKTAASAEDMQKKVQAFGGLMANSPSK